jgi:hypothetical protein
MELTLAEVLACLRCEQLIAAPLYGSAPIHTYSVTSARNTGGINDDPVGIPIVFQSNLRKKWKKAPVFRVI